MFKDIIIHCPQFLLYKLFFALRTPVFSIFTLVTSRKRLKTGLCADSCITFLLRIVWKQKADPSCKISVFQLSILLPPSMWTLEMEFEIVQSHFSPNFFQWQWYWVLCICNCDKIRLLRADLHNTIFAYDYRMQSAYNTNMTWIISSKSYLRQLCDSRTQHEKCRSILEHVLKSRDML